MKFNLVTPLFDDQTLAILKLGNVAAPPAEQQQTLQQLFVQILITDDPQEKVPAEDKVKRYVILQKISGASDGLVDFSPSEVGIMDKLIDARCPTLIHGRVKTILSNPIADKEPSTSNG